MLTEQTKTKSPPDPAVNLRRAGIIQPYEILMWLPKRHEDYSLIVGGHDYLLHEGKKVCIELTVIGRPTSTDKGKFTVATVDDANQIHRLMLFGMLRFSPWGNVHPGQKIWVRAKVVKINEYHYLNSAEWVEKDIVGTVRPVYAGRQGVVSAAVITEAARTAISNTQNGVDAAMAVREAFGGMDEAEIIKLAGCGGTLPRIIQHIHAPVNIESAEWAMNSAKKIAVAYVRWSAERAGKRQMAMKSIIRISGDHMRKLVDALPFKLTTGDDSQTTAVRGLIQLLNQPYPMDALLSADVGVGKTVCYGLVAAAAQQLGYRVAIMIPNSILVEQVTRELRNFFPGTPIAQISEGSADIPDCSSNPILIGTTKLFGVSTRAKWLPDLLIIDEQQKTAEAQRNRLRGPHTNVLEATATPIPRSMALLAHGGKQLIQVRTQHADKQIVTQVIDQSHKAEMFAKIKKRVADGDQVAIIYPRVAATSSDDIKSVIAAGNLWERHFHGQVAVLHGKMKDEEKSATMKRIREEGTAVIIASSIIEIGVTIKNLRFLMVVHAERYGVFTLHQFRGRIARMGGEGECLLYLPEEVDEESLERIKLLETTNDGFELAEKDMNMRGFGDLAETEGTQSGKTATLFRGVRLMPHDLAG